jgi:hypothetical protein
MPGSLGPNVTHGTRPQTRLPARQGGGVTPPQVPQGIPVLNPQGGTQLVTDPNQTPVLTANRETDARTALARGLKEYLETLVTGAQGGREVRFKKVFSTWAEAEAAADYPSGSIVSPSPGIYDWSGFTPAPPVDQLPPPDGRFLQKLCEFDQVLQLEVWCADPKMRAEMSSLIEQQMSPVDWMYGCRLYLPHFYGEFADFELRSQQYVDSEDQAIKRYRNVVFGIHAHMGVRRLVKFPMAKPSTQTSIVATQDTTQAS